MLQRHILPDRFWDPPRGVTGGKVASAEVKKRWLYKSTPPQIFMPKCSVSKAKGQLYSGLILDFDILVSEEMLNKHTELNGTRRSSVSTEKMLTLGEQRLRTFQSRVLGRTFAS
jgi:hypothetical protein